MTRRELWPKKLVAALIVLAHWCSEPAAETMWGLRGLVEEGVTPAGIGGVARKA